MLLNDIGMMKRRVNRLANMAECLEHSVCPAIGQEQTNQLTAMSSELDEMKATFADRLPPRHHDTVCANRWFYSLFLHLLQSLTAVTSLLGDTFSLLN